MSDNNLNILININKYFSLKNKESFKDFGSLPFGHQYQTLDKLQIYFHLYSILLLFFETNVSSRW